MSTPGQNLVAQAMKIFACEQLGEGDLVAGANVLTAMAFALAGVYRSDSCVETEGGDLPVGSSVLVAGGLSSALVVERVLRPLAERQNNLIANHRQFARYAQVQARRHPKDQDVDITEKLAPSQGGPLLDLLSSGLTFPGEASDAARLTRPSSDGKSDLHLRPVFYSGVRDIRELVETLERAHLRKILLHVQLNYDSGHLSQLGRVCSPLMQGGYCAGQTGETIQGHVIATAPSLDVLRNTGASWVAQMPWLTETPRLPVPDLASAGKVVALNDVSKRFLLALDQALERRLDFRPRAPFTQKADDFQKSWRGFLAENEAVWPGITGVGRSWLATLLFGMCRLKGAAPNPSGFQWPTSIATFARWQVSRMIESRLSDLRSSHEARIAGIAQTLRHRLTAEPLPVRDLVRKFHRLPSADCLEALEILASQGVAVASARGWYLAPSNSSQEPPQNHVLDI